MGDNTLLLVGAALVFAGLVVAGLLAFRPAPAPTGVARSLLVIEQTHLNPLGPVPDPSATERLFLPAVGQDRRSPHPGRDAGPAAAPARPGGQPPRLDRRTDPGDQGRGTLRGHR